MPGGEELRTGEQAVGAGPEGPDLLVGRETLDERSGTSDVGPGQVDLAGDAPGMVLRAG
ncbi:MAG: hypothetical protein ACYCXY_07560 [Acidimicrobiales bacterium]